MAEHEETGCAQAGTIGEIRATLRFFQESEERRERRDERLIEAVEKIAAHGATIEAHAETLARHDKAHGEAFERIRKLEDPPLLAKLASTKTGRCILAVLLCFAVTVLSKNPAVMETAIKCLIGG